MTIFQRYFKHQLKNSLRSILVVTVAILLVFLLTAVDSDRFYEYRYDLNTGEVLNYRFEYEYDYDEDYDDFYYNDYDSYGNKTESSGYVKTFSTFLSFPTVVLLVMAFAIPISQFKFFKKRQNLDCVYSLPLSRKNFALAHYLVGLVYLAIPAIATYLMVFIRITLNNAWIYLNIKYVVLQFLSSFLFAWAFYSFVSFIYNEANNEFDGVVFVFLWQSIASTITNIFAPYSMYFTLFGMPFALSTAAETTPYELHHIQFYEKESTTFPVVYSLIWLALGIVLMVLLLKRFGKVRTEKIEGVSDSIFGYKLLIPYLAITLLIELDTYLGIFYINSDIGIGAFIFALIGYAVYRRGLKLKKSDIISLGVIAALSIICDFIGPITIEF